LEREGERIQVGRLGRTRGVQGWLWITPDTDFAERFTDLESILVSDRDDWQEFRVEAAKVIGGRPLIKFVGVDSREDAARLTNRTLAVAREQLMPLPPDAHYVFDLVGCDVHDNGDDHHLGKIVDVLRYPANDVYLIRTDSGNEVLFPAVSDFVRSIDTAGRKVIVVSGGLFDGTDKKNEP
jgi:16S rRNA processing protein RimM